LNIINGNISYLNYLLIKKAMGIEARKSSKKVVQLYSLFPLHFIVESWYFNYISSLEDITIF